ncbi:MAG: S-layer homology domain-containing protein [Eubacteriales bacterium]
MKKLMAIAAVILMTLTLLPLGAGVDVVSGATGSTGGGGGGTPTGTAPAAPTLLALQTAFAPSATTAKLTWKDNSATETGFKLERILLGGSSWMALATLGANVTTYTDSSLKPATTYYYRVKAYNTYGTSAASNELAITTAKATVTPPPVVIGPVYSDTPSPWATAEIDKAVAAGLTVDTLLSKYDKPITRLEFSELVVKLYEKATGEIAVPVSPNPFTDTTNEDVLKAFALGIVNGVSADKFAPNANITRQELSVMLLRELKAAKPDGIYTVGADYANVFADESQIAIWAIDAVRFMNQEGIVNGIGAGKVDPKGNTTREQSMLMDYRTYEQFVLPLAPVTDAGTISTPTTTVEDGSTAE